VVLVSAIRLLRAECESRAKDKTEDGISHKGTAWSTLNRSPRPV
jgi:hypothetical protein